LSTWLKDIKAKSRKTVVSPISERDYEIRKLTSSEVMQANLSPVIGTLPDKDITETQALAWLAGQKDNIAASSTRYVLQKGVTSCQIVYEDDDDKVPEGAVNARWISDDERWLYLEVLAFSGIIEDAARAELDSYRKNAIGSEPSTKSPEPSEDSLTKS